VTISRKVDEQILGIMSARKIEKVLTEWANMATDVEQLEAACSRLLRLCPEVFGNYPDNTLDTAGLFCGLLQKAWDARGERERNWYLVSLESFYHRTSNHFIDPPKTVTAMEAVMNHFRRNARRALHCLNPECPAPYFFAKKKGQRYCTTDCARPAQLASKRRWWSDHRKELTAKKRKRGLNAKS